MPESSLRRNRRLQILQESRNNALHRGAAILGRLGDFAHQAQPAAAEHQRETQGGNARAQRPRRLAEPGIGAEG